MKQEKITFDVEKIKEAILPYYPRRTAFTSIIRVGTSYLDAEFRKDENTLEDFTTAVFPRMEKEYGSLAKMALMFFRFDELAYIGSICDFQDFSDFNIGDPLRGPLYEEMLKLLKESKIYQTDIGKKVYAIMNMFDSGSNEEMGRAYDAVSKEWFSFLESYFEQWITTGIDPLGKEELLEKKSTKALLTKLRCSTILMASHPKNGAAYCYYQKNVVQMENEILQRAKEEPKPFKKG